MINELAEMLEINHSQSLQLIVQSTKTCELCVNVKENVNCALVLTLECVPELDLKLHCGAASQVNLFVMNESASKVELNQSAEVEEDASLTLSFAEFNEAASFIKSTVSLNGTASQCNMNSALLCKTEKEMAVLIHHKASMTKSFMNHSGVLLEGGKLFVDAIGKIDRGAKGSKSHQKSRALTFDQPKSATVLPQLLIDENDVEASHATSVGQIDENQMYYLQSRGLSKAQATQLITLGALMPIAEVLEDETLKAQMQQKIEAKVNEVCSM